MIRSFADDATKDLWNGESTTASRRIPASVWPAAQRKLDLLQAASDLRDLAVPPGNRLEKLRGRLSRFHSIRVNERWRIVFRWVDGEAEDVSLTDYH